MADQINWGFIFETDEFFYLESYFVFIEFHKFTTMDSYDI